MRPSCSFNNYRLLMTVAVFLDCLLLEVKEPLFNKNKVFFFFSGVIVCIYNYI